MSETLHPVEQEQVMALLDGQLSGEEAARTERHLRECADCQELAADLQGVSGEMKFWDVTPSAGVFPAMLDAALSEREKLAAKKGVLAWLPKTRVTWTLGFAATTVVVLLAVGVLLSLRLSAPPATSKRLPVTLNENVNSEAGIPLNQVTRGELERLGVQKKIQSQGQSVLMHEPSGAAMSVPPQSGSASVMAFQASAEVSAGGASGVKPVTMIARSAQLSIVVTDFRGAESRLEEILKQHDGYIGDMKITAPEDSARKLTAELRVPAPQMDATIAELKKLGRVESESQNGEDVTSQYVDLQARLKNARNTEQRLTDLLQQRTGKLSDVVEVEDKISEVRESIERMEAEQKNLSTRVQFASVSVSLTEEHKAQLNVVPPSLGTRFHNAAVEGYESVADGLIGLLLFLMSWGPTLLIWAAVLFLPVRFAWRRLHREA